MLISLISYFAKSLYQKKELDFVTQPFQILCYFISILRSSSHPTYKCIKTKSSESCTLRNGLSLLFYHQGELMLH